MGGGGLYSTLVVFLHHVNGQSVGQVPSFVVIRVGSV